MLRCIHSQSPYSFIMLPNLLHWGTDRMPSGLNYNNHTISPTGWTLPLFTSQMDEIRARVWENASKYMHACACVTSPWTSEGRQLACCRRAHTCRNPTHASRRPFTSIWLPFFRFQALLGEARPGCMGHNMVPCTDNHNTVFLITLPADIGIPPSSSTWKQNLISFISSHWVLVLLTLRTISGQYVCYVKYVLHIQTHKMSGCYHVIDNCNQIKCSYQLRLLAVTKTVYSLNHA